VNEGAFVSKGVRKKKACNTDIDKGTGISVDVPDRLGC
jgi:hypothetical protein